jgi:phosphatidylglycerol:prolipoprotein diacylglycerol transferase
MLVELGRIGPVVIRTYTLLLDLALIIGLGTLLWYGNHTDQRPARWVDAGLGGIVLGIVAGRLGHVALYWHYFRTHQAEIWQVWRGGLDWHMAVLGGLLGMTLMAKVRGVPLRELYDVVAMILPVGVVLTYAGCLSTSCGHGIAVGSLAAYPAWMVAELPDLFGVVEPRFASQLFGIALGVLLLLIAVIMANTVERPGLRLWIVITLLGAGAFGIGFTRGDEIRMIGALRLDQVLDLGMVAVGLLGLIVSVYRLPLYFEKLLPDLDSSETI